jgi:hypothetical protein
MATTISIDDEIFEDQPAAEQPFELVTFGQGGRFTTYDVDRISSLIEIGDLTP